MTTTRARPDSLRVLLLSPMAGIDPGNGDVTYTEQLLGQPPSGVTYVTYPDALRSGTLVEHHRRRQGESAWSALSREGVGLAREGLVNKARARGLLFREPFRHFSVSPGAFDLVHAHVYSLRMRSDPRVPLVVSNSVPIDALYRDAFGEAPGRVERKRRLDTRLASLTGVTHSAYGQDGASTVICFSEHLRQTFLHRDHLDPNRYVVVPPGIDPGPAPTPAVDQGGLHIGFIGDWHSKGGDLVLAAHRRLRAGGMNSRLTVVSGEPRMNDEESRHLNVAWLPRLPRDQLLNDVIPTFSVFAYPSRFDGLPLTLLEVMAKGVPVIVSDYGALPEVVEQGRAGAVVKAGSLEALESAVLSLRDPAARVQQGAAARERIIRTYALDRVTDTLADVYASAGPTLPA